jgi:PAS domain S-box-containing protein
MGFVHMIDTAELKGAVRLHQAAILDASDDAIIFENLEVVILAWNSAAERTFGYTADEAIGRSMAIVISPEFQPTQIEILERLRAGHDKKLQAGDFIRATDSAVYWRDMKNGKQRRTLSRENGRNYFEKHR